MLKFREALGEGLKLLAPAPTRRLAADPAATLPLLPLTLLTLLTRAAERKEEEAAVRSAAILNELKGNGKCKECSILTESLGPKRER